MSASERRAWPQAEVRASDVADKAPQITGYAAVFDSPSEEIEEWGFTFTEIIRPGAFARTVHAADIRALVNHDPGYVLGRNMAGTLALAEDTRGLAVDISPPDTQWSRDLQTSMRRGDVNQMSFAFEVIRDRFTEDKAASRVLRELLEVKLFDVSVVTFPAYPTTSAAVRNLWQGAGLDFGGVTGVLIRQQAGIPLSCTDDDSCIEETIKVLRNYLPAIPGANRVRTHARRRMLNLLTVA